MKSRARRASSATGAGSSSIALWYIASARSKSSRSRNRDAEVCSSAICIFFGSSSIALRYIASAPSKSSRTSPNGAEVVVGHRVLRVELDAALVRLERRLGALPVPLVLGVPDGEPRVAHLGVLRDGRAVRDERFVELALVLQRGALGELAAAVRRICRCDPRARRRRRLPRARPSRGCREPQTARVPGVGPCAMMRPLQRSARPGSGFTARTSTSRTSVMKLSTSMIWCSSKRR